MSIYKKLFEAKKEMSAITKDSENPFFKSKYFDINKLLSEVKPVLQKHGLLLLQPITDEHVESVIIDVSDKDLKCVISSKKLPNIQDTQKLGSAITYYRKFTLLSLLNLKAQAEACFSGTKEQIENDLQIVESNT